MSDEWRKLDVRVLALHAARLAGAVAPIALVLLLGGDLNRTVVISLVFICGGAALRAATDALAWATTRYRVGDELVELRSGLLRRSALSVPRDRVRTVNLTAKPLQRLFRIATVEIGTGTHEQGRLRLDAVATDEAARLRQALLARAEVPAAPAASLAAPASLAADTLEVSPAPLAGPATPSVAPGSDAAPPEPVLARLRWGWLPYHLLSPWTLALPIAGLGAVLNALNQLGVEASVGRIAEHAAVDGIHRADDVSWWLAILLGLLAVVVLAVLGAVGAGLQFAESWWGYRLTREQSGNLHSRRGLLTTRSVSIEHRRLRGATLTEPLLQRAIGGAGLNAIVSGLRRRPGERGGRADGLLPNVPRAEADAVLADVLEAPSLPGELRELRPHPRAALRRRLLRALIAVALPVAALLAMGPLLGWLPDWLWWAAAGVLVVPALLLGRDAYRALGHRIAGQYLVTRRGAPTRRTAVLRCDGVIGWTVKRSFFQRRAGLVTLTATTAAGGGGYSVFDVAEADGLAFAEEAVPGLLAPFLDGGDRPGG
ncbi:PH domain-containing protein [Conexibacter stalactiti]|uniref:PH domain-containing protein n=1 Tax=Conexibacter stalactiti TaxID=1940611 RepID=A0ABU4HJJ0_9ACTN|nr:PH domain-containing protein [Conexibacter stalactiti]MDW5593485.1 PH domain-containing protein [Conexibacter stalactiti]MEC5034126.1 PH domain-containing protein [Conexibacter stalactiti]